MHSVCLCFVLNCHIAELALVITVSNLFSDLLSLQSCFNMSVEELQQKVKQLESQIEVLRARVNQDGPVRPKIEQMSSEVVDANPYRYGKRTLGFISLRTFIY